jgi:heterodisulfide reductase subunit A-like polyferredoxin
VWAEFRPLLIWPTAGLKVYLVEEESRSGARWPADKTFPPTTVPCVLFAELVEVGKHLNIEILSYAEVLKLEGDIGKLFVQVKQKPRFIDLEKCTGCRRLRQGLPGEIPNEFDACLNSRRAAYKRYPQAIPNAFAIEKLGVSPCKATCPAGIHVLGFIALIRE